MTEYCHCQIPKTKVRRTHGMNSRGYLVCRHCKKIVRKK